VDPRFTWDANNGYLTSPINATKLWIPESTVAMLPATATTGQLVLVTDPLVTGSCATGGGTGNPTLCRYNGSGWAAAGGPASYSMTTVAGDMACAHAGDTTINAKTITGGSSTATTITVNLASTTNFYVGAAVVVSGATPAGYNVSSATVTAVAPGSSITYSSTNNPGAWTSGGTIACACGNQTNDALSANPYYFGTQSIPANSVQAGKLYRFSGTYRAWSSNPAPSISALQVQYGATNVYASSGALAQAGAMAAYIGEFGWDLVGLSNSSVLVAPTATSYPTTSSPVYFSNVTASPATVTTSSAQNVGARLWFAASGIGTFTATGGTVTGASGQTCLLTAFNGAGGSGATATAKLTATNTLAGSTVTITNTGTGYTSTSTSATLGNGTATCSGTATLTMAALAGAQGNAVQQMALVMTSN
jgi:hypothetical protein